MNDGLPELGEVPDANNNQGPKYTGHMDTSKESKKAGKRKADDYLVASKWKNRMVNRYFTSTGTDLDTKMIRGNRATRIIRCV